MGRRGREEGEGEEKGRGEGRERERRGKRKSEDKIPAHVAIPPAWNNYE